MLKKLLVVAAVAAVVGAGVKGTRLSDRVRHEVGALRDWADDQVPVDKKLALMRADVAALDRDVEAVKDDLSKEIVEVRALAAQVAALAARVAAEDNAIRDRADRLRAAAEPSADAKDALQRDVDAQLKRKQSLDFQRKAVARREQMRDALGLQLEALARQKLELAAAVDLVEAEYKDLQLQQMESRYQTDDTRLARVKADLAALQKKLDVERERLKLSPVGRTQAARTADKSVDDIVAPLDGPAQAARAD